MRVVVKRAKQLQQERGLSGTGLECEMSSKDEIERTTKRRTKDNPTKFRRFANCNERVTHFEAQEKRGMKRKAPEATVPAV